MYFADAQARVAQQRSSVATALPFPFVPATWNDADTPVRIAERARAAPRVRSSPNLYPPVVRANR